MQLCFASVSPGRDDCPQVVYRLPQHVGLHHQIQLVVLLRLTRHTQTGEPRQSLPELPLCLQVRHTCLPSQSLLRLGTDGTDVPLSPNQVVYLCLEDLATETVFNLVKFRSDRRGCTAVSTTI